MGTAPSAGHFGTNAKSGDCRQRPIFMFRDNLTTNIVLGGIDGGSKAGPATATLKLFPRMEQWFAAADATVCACCFGVPVGSTESPLSPLFAGDGKLLRG
jgi:hypothetical protein